MKKFLLASAASAYVLAAPFATAQTSYGTVEGAVKDVTGAVVPQAVVTATSKLTGETHTTNSKANGAFHIESLGTGSYDIIVTAPGFDKTVVAGVVVNPSVTTAVNPILQVGQAQETVEVSGTNQILQTESGEIAATIEHKEITDLPLSSLNVYSFATTLPGVTTVTTLTGSSNVTRFSSNGFRARENNFLIEGQDNNDAGLTGTGLTPENEEAADTVTFLLNSNSAEFGRGGGAISNLVFRSGTNEFHGAGWDRILNSSLNATDHSLTYLHAAKTKFRENIFGFRLGGPIKKNKLFLFGSQQYDRYRATATLGTLVMPLLTPSASGCISPISKTGVNYTNLNNYKSNPQIAKLLQAYAGLASTTTASCAGTLSRTDPNYREISLGPDPATGVDRGTVQFGSYQRSLGNVQNQNEIDIKGDYLISDRDKLQLRFIRSASTIPFDTGNFPSQLPNLETNQHGASYNAGIVYNHTFSPNVLNELRISYGRIGFTFDLTPGTYSNPLLGPTVTISNIQGFGIPTNTPQGRFHNTYQIQDGLTFVKGSHSAKVGFDVAQVRVRDAVPFVFYGSQSYIISSAYSALGNYMDDYSGNNGTATSSLTKYFGNNLARPTLTNQAYYIQDHWKIAKNFATDLGMRYEYYGAPFNYLQYPAIDPSNIACYPCKVQVQPQYHNFAPRVNFAYTPFESQKTVLRGGIGVYYDNVFTNIADNLQASAPNAAAPTLYNANTGRGTAAWSQQFASLNTAPLATNSVTSVVPNLRNPLTLQYNLSVEQQLPSAMSVTASYIGTRGEHLYALDYLNPVIPGSTSRLVTSRAAISVHDNTGDSDYNAGTLELRRRFRSIADVRIAYTYSKTLDDNSDDYTTGNYSAYPQVQLPFSNNRGIDWGPSALDHRQRAVATIIYSVPVWHTDGFKRAIAALTNNTEVSTITSYQSGSVVNLQSGLDWNGDGVTNDRPVQINPSAPIGSFAVLSTDYYTAATGAAPGVYCDATYIANFGTSANNRCHPVALNSVRFFLGNRNTLANNTIRRNSYYTPGLFQGDFTAGRTFKTFERQDFTVRAECFNCLNHANSGIPNATLYSSGNTPAGSSGTNTFFNYAPTASGGRTLRFFLRYEF